MAVANLTYPRFKAFKAGEVLAGGKVYVYVAGTTDKAPIYTDVNATAQLSNPVTLDSNGEKEIWFDGEVKVLVEDAQGNQMFTMDNVRSDIPPEDIGRFNLVENGSFEIDSAGDGLPDDWTITEEAESSTVELDTTSVAHGARTLKFVSTGDGGGVATTTAFFPVHAGKNCVVAFSIRSTVADVRNQVQVRYFDKDQTFVSADTVYDEDTSNPTSFEEQRLISSVPATATYAKLRLVGCDPSNDTSGTTFFDDVRVFSDASAAVYSEGLVAFDISKAITSGGTDISFPNVDSDVTATDEELNTLDGFTGSTNDLNSISKIETGTYTGDGTESNSISGLGFAPKFLNILALTGSTVTAHVTNNTLVTTDPDGRSQLQGTSGSTGATNRIKSLDSDGFTVSDAGADSNPNANGVTYYYTAWG